MRRARSASTGATSTRDPSLAGRELIAALGATEVAICTASGELVCEHKRAYGPGPTDTCDPASQLALLAVKTGGKCPIGGLPPYCTSRWDVCDLCGAFDCGACAASPEDPGLTASPSPSVSQEEASREMPF